MSIVVEKKDKKYVSDNAQFLKEWDYVNNVMKPNNMSPYSHKKAFWICSNCGHQWEAEIKSRNNGSGCPKCRNRKKN